MKIKNILIITLIIIGLASFGYSRAQGASLWKVVSSVLSPVVSTWNVTVGADLTISGDDLYMATNTDAYILVADGTNYNPVAVSGEASIDNTGAVSVLAMEGVDFGTLTDTKFCTYDLATTEIDCDSAGAGEWTTTSNVVHLNTSTDTVTVGSSTALGKLSADGDADEIQLLIQGHSTQTSDIVVFEQSNGTDLFTFDNTGLLEVKPGAAVGDALIQLATGGTTQWTIGLDDSDSDSFKISTGSDFASGNALVISTAGAVNFDGATSLEIVNAAAPTVDVAGEIAIDTTNDQFIYYGGAKRVIDYEKSVCVTIENLAAADDDLPLYSNDEAITITAGWGHCKGTCTTNATIDFQDSDANGMTMTDFTTSDWGTEPTPQAVSGNGGLIAYEGFSFNVTNAVDPETDTYLLCFSFTTDAQ